jgi:hypothetical protein
MVISSHGHKYQLNLFSIRINCEVHRSVPVCKQHGLVEHSKYIDEHCEGCSEPASIPGGVYRVSDYEVGASVEYECDYGYEMLGSSRAFCMVPSEWYPLPPICKCEMNLSAVNDHIQNVILFIDNPCTTDCQLCDQKMGVCLRQQTKQDPLLCDPPCEDDEVCIDGQCSWSNIEQNINEHQCNPSCPFGSQCIHRQCEPSSRVLSCSIPCQFGQVCVDGQCGCFKGKHS